MADLENFVRESNKIEGILRDPTEAEISATAAFLRLDDLGVDDVANIVRVYQPDARLRDRPMMNVRVGSHYAPQGGPEIVGALEDILFGTDILHDPYHAHIQYELLHPFTDGNGRSGRALWARQMLRFNISPGLKLGFLHAFYYQTLSASR